ncbi:hypothetical protein [Alienimonas chondri]|uniref:Tetratricopeptide repeat protein n=1 Tax=Alienimonas chondri TaxID=2681879 RepID=A0ABX1VCQ5_9PLAN|nr:hypothetical protein [Alienimonas chondri]NNJ25206.1 hypothetical protein [Alienimonas chondri]
MTRLRPLAAVAAVSALLLTPAASACLWDTDTLWQERQEFPGTLELIVGKFPRHTDAFYEHRISTRGAALRLHALGERAMSAEDRAAAYDDLAVALDKLGRRDEALATLDKKVADVGELGEYETAANRGTILIHAGRFEEGLGEIDRALAINPDAHFGRERIQKLLVEYMLEKKSDAEAMPAPLAPIGPNREGFAKFLQERKVSLKDGRKGVEGMMRFGDYRSPALLEALGDLLMAPQVTSEFPDPAAARLLASRAYLAAGRSAPEAADAFHELAATALQMQQIDGQDVETKQVAEALEREFAETDEWFEKVREDEALWIEKSPDPDARFQEKYGVAILKVGDTSGRPSHIQDQWSADARHWPLDAAIGVGGLLTLAGIWALIAWRRRSPSGWEGS